jgi:hypothetical protein
MVSKPNMNPNNAPIHGPKPPQPEPAWRPKPLKWMGMSFNTEQTKQLWSTISQTIGQAIQKDRDRMVAASKKLQKSSDLENEDDS